MLNPDMILIVIVAFSAVLATALVVFMTLVLLKNRRQLDQARLLTEDGLALLDRAGSRDTDSVTALFSLSDRPELQAFGERLASISQLHFQGRFLPDPGPVLASLGLFPSQQMKESGRLSSLICFSLGAGGFVLALLLPFAAGLTTLALPVSLSLLLLALVCALVTLWHTYKSALVLEEEKNRLCVVLAAKAPVFMDSTGVAVLVSEMIGYGERIRSEVVEFSRLADELAAGEFAEGIKTSVREIMKEEVAPPLKDSNYALTELARSLAEKQEQGMADLADSFSDSVAQALSQHLAPLPDKLQILHQVAAHSSDMMEEATASMARTRDESKEINEDVREALRLMALAKNDIADEMASISDSLEILAESTGKMTALYADEETDLASHIKEMTEQLRIYSEKIGQGITESSKAIEASVKMSASHNKNAAILMERLDEQLSILEDLGRQISDNTTNFTKESASFVSRTLEEYDVSLAEVVERLTFTTAEIRDAIDVLPQAIRGAGDN